MLKKLFGIFIPLCIFSFIAFGVSAAVLGTGYGSASYVVDEAMEGTGNISSWETNESYTNIKLDAGAYNVMLVPGIVGDDTTYFNDDRFSNNCGDVFTRVDGDTLEITINGGNINLGFDYLDRLFEAIRTGEGFDEIFAMCTLTVTVPPRVYESLDVNIGSGSLEIVNINAQSNTVCLNSGKISYFNDNDFTADSIGIEVGSGYIQAYGMHTREYDIEINSGKYEIFGLSGEGSIDVNSGNGNVDFYRLDGNCDVYMNSGTVDIYIPYNASARLAAGINSGGVYVNSAEIGSTRMRDGDIVTLGGGEHEMNFTINSGTVSVSEYYPEEETVISGTSDLSQIDFGLVPAEDVITSIVEAQVESAVEVAAENMVHFIEAPEPPSALKPPKPSWIFAPASASYKQG